jgi:hypothetical protein
MIVVLIGVVKVMNWVPTAVQEGALKKYKSVEEVKSTLQIGEIYVPSYFPQHLTWPPSEILAQTRPFIAVQMTFRRVDTGEIALIISQSSGTGTFPGRRISITQIKERVPYSLEGRDAVLEVGVCKNNEPCSQISWKEGKYLLTVSMKSTPFDLIKLADSMIR